MFARIRAVSSYLPAKTEKNSDFVNERFREKLGIVDRHIAADDESAGDLAFKAAEKLFAEYDIDRNETDFILLCTQHPDYQVPNTKARIFSAGSSTPSIHVAVAPSPKSGRTDVSFTLIYFV